MLWAGLHPGRVSLGGLVTDSQTRGLTNPLAQTLKINTRKWRPWGGKTDTAGRLAPGRRGSPLQLAWKTQEVSPSVRWTGSREGGKAAWLGSNHSSGY